MNDQWRSLTFRWWNVVKFAMLSSNRTKVQRRPHIPSKTAHPSLKADEYATVLHKFVEISHNYAKFDHRAALESDISHAGTPLINVTFLKTPTFKTP
ncbi:hypothetical protein PAXRUDRAFT_557068 [Paxillus rubicundulus Ve08.2h10]|uniref:Uncharacterized protein n=1 Tax=Paxillus rubicundulus Ve08.2h10 TaxID=930991 RepID=A0A0D0DUH1_9AGAM|nr:hypothetical protein PAXRUDRAFT_557068 [Paxillus rubicundulus Ve08.2h10]